MKGRTVTHPPQKAPPKYLRVACACCGKPRRAINGHWLAYLRQRARVDQRTLAATVGVSGPYLSDIERNRRAISAAILAAYTDGLRRGPA